MTSGVGRCRPAAFVQPPVGEQIAFVTGERTVLERLDFVGGQGAVPDGDFVQCALKALHVIVIATDQNGFGVGGCARGRGPGSCSDDVAIEKQFPARSIHDHRGVVPPTVGHDGDREGIDGEIGEGAIIKSAQPSVLHDESPAVAQAVRVLADDSLNDGGGIRGAKPRRDRQRKGVQIRLVWHLDVAIHPVEFESVGRHRCQGNRRSGRNPCRTAYQSPAHSPRDRVARGGARPFIQVPKAKQTIRVAREPAVLDVIHCVVVERLVPD